MLLFSHHHPSSKAYFIWIPDTIDAKFKLGEKNMFQEFSHEITRFTFVFS